MAAKLRERPGGQCEPGRRARQAEEREVREERGLVGPTGAFDFILNETGAVRGFEKGRKVSTAACFYNQGNRAAEMVNNLRTRASGRAGI